MAKGIMIALEDGTHVTIAEYVQRLKNLAEAVLDVSEAMVKFDSKGVH